MRARTTENTTFFCEYRVKQLVGVALLLYEMQGA